MSRTKAFKGKIRKTDLTELEILKKIGVTEYPDYYESAGEYLEDEHGDKYAEIDGDIYEILTKEEFDYNGCFESVKNDDGTIDYTVIYYNGGCGFHEALGDALKTDH